MIRFLVYLFAGIVLAIVIHLGTILAMPMVSTNSAWQKMRAEAPYAQVSVFDGSNNALSEALQLDPAFVHAICPLSVANEPFIYFGNLPTMFWTAALVASDGSVPYSTTSRTNANGEFNLAIFNTNQAVGLAAGDYELDPSMTIVKVDRDELIAVVRLLPDHRTLRAEVAKHLREELICEPL